MSIYPYDREDLRHMSEDSIIEKIAEANENRDIAMAKRSYYDETMQEATMKRNQLSRELDQRHKGDIVGVGVTGPITSVLHGFIEDARMRPDCFIDGTWGEGGLDNLVASIHAQERHLGLIMTSKYTIAEEILHALIAIPGK